ncbi:MAG: hypothetical protein AVDCRST_MAG87-2850 [uncultured Thermomicrobiales bacterium]|uniref:HEAT repeat domain-containing protein n=1 Tax=uncultured Thermomicrobiales bacterium TaxID=1645740 RepID=A0A6J4VDL7_9BACT|nr:MAG: hypothetical protein AVDCRST_MAG87-2850 [uncultured Thermomicrobiales bacterium]
MARARATGTPPKTGRKPSVHAEASGQIAALTALDGDPAAQRAEAIRLVETSRHPGIVRAALLVLQHAEDPALRPLMHATYDRYDGAPERNDSGGIVRAAIVRTLQPIVHPDDEPLLHRALRSYQMLGLYELCAELRTAGLLALNDLDPDVAALYAARFLTDPRNSNAGEPALSAIRLLAAQQNLGPVLSVASWDTVASFSGGNGEIIGEALRNLTGLPVSMVPLLIERHRHSEDEQVLLGLYDLLLAHPARATWHDEIADFLRTTPLLDLYGLVATQIVVTRDEALIGALRDLAATEREPRRAELLAHALEHA